MDRKTKKKRRLRYISKFIFATILIPYSVSCQVDTKQNENTNTGENSELSKYAHVENRPAKLFKLKLSEQEITINDNEKKNLAELLSFIEESGERIYVQNSVDSVMAIKIFVEPSYSIDEYKKVIDGIRGLYEIIWQDKSRMIYNKDFSDLTDEERDEIKRLVPYYVSENPG